MCEIGKYLLCKIFTVYSSVQTGPLPARWAPMALAMGRKSQEELAS